MGFSETFKNYPLLKPAIKAHVAGYGGLLGGGVLGALLGGLLGTGEHDLIGHFNGAELGALTGAGVGGPLAYFGKGYHERAKRSSKLTPDQKDRLFNYLVFPQFMNYGIPTMAAYHNIPGIRKPTPDTIKDRLRRLLYAR